MNAQDRRLLRLGVVKALFAVLLLSSSGYSAIRLVDSAGLSFRIAEGFRITEALAPGLCPRVEAITFDSQGRLIVATPLDIRTLFDSDSDGVYDRFVVFANVPRTSFIIYDLNSLYFFNQGAIWRMTDNNGDGIADTPPQRLLDIKGNEPLFGALKRGPDGWWYLSIRSGANIDSLKLHPSSLITRKHGGALLRVTPDFSTVQIYAHGFYSPVGFDFDLAGKIFVADAGGKNSNFLPWETGSRLIEAKYGWHYGWLSTSDGDFVFHPEYYFDNGSSVENLGVMLPSKPAVYLHNQFPEVFRGGVFLPIWSAGKILFFAKPKDLSSLLPSETFLETMGNSDFAPVDIAVSPDGSLVVATGGAMAKSTIYRISYGEMRQKPQELVEKLLPVLTVLNAPQPFEAWSRARWMPVAEQAGVQSFSSAIVSELYSTEQRIRAIDVKIDMAEGLTFREVRSAARAVSADVREKLVRTLCFYPIPNMDGVLNSLVFDPSIKVRISALDALTTNSRDAQNPRLPLVLQLLNEKEKEVLLAVSKLASSLAEDEWDRFLGATTNGAINARMIAGMAMVFRKQKQSFNPDLINLALSIFTKATELDLRLDALRLAIIGLGDYPPQIPSSKISLAIEPNADRKDVASVFARMMVALKPGFPSVSLENNIELSRLLTMLKDPDRKTATYLISMIRPQSPINQDFFHLSAYAVLPPPQTSYDPAPVAAALATFLNKLEMLPPATRQQRNEYVDLLISVLLKREPAIADSLLKNPSYIRQCLPYIGPYLDLNRQQQAFNQFIEVFSRTQRPQLTPAHLQWLLGFTNQVVRSILLQHWTNELFQDEILIYLASNPQIQDRDRFFAGLASHNHDVVMACLDGLLRLPPDTSPAAQLRVFQLLRRLVQEPEQKPLRERTVRLLTLMGGIPHIQEEIVSDRQSIEKIYEPAFIRFSNMYPTLATWLDGNPDPEAVRVMNIVRFQQLPTGNSKRGLQVFEKRRCVNCHNPIHEYAPDLFKYAQTVSIQTFVRDIVYPQFKISRIFNGESLFLRNGKRIYASPTYIGNDYTFLRTSATNTIRIPSHEIIGVKKADISPMPSGLLNGATPQEIADLFKFLKEPVY